jgi:hypothetical protein
MGCGNSRLCGWFYGVDADWKKIEPNFSTIEILNFTRFSEEPIYQRYSFLMSTGG